VVKILAVCGNGLGSSFACQMTTEAVMRDMGVEVKMDHIDISSVSGQKADIIVSGKNFEPQFAHLNLNCPVVFLDRLVDKNEIREKLTPVLKELGAL
jgi:PTS system ascorbate-specific IIB component